MVDAPFKINFSDSDATSEPTSYEALPAGDYIVNVTKVELVKVKNGANKGKPQMNIEVTVDPDNGEFVKRKFWKLIGLFEYEYKDGTRGNFMLAQWLKATGYGHAIKTGNVPAAPAYMGKKLIAVVAKKRQDEAYGGGFRNEIVGFRALEGANNESENSDSNMPS